MPRHSPPAVPKELIEQKIYDRYPHPVESQAFELTDHTVHSEPPPAGPEGPATKSASPPQSSKPSERQFLAAMCLRPLWLRTRTGFASFAADVQTRYCLLPIVGSSPHNEVARRGFPLFASACALADSACAATVLVADGLALSGTTAVAVPAHGETVTSCSTLAVRDCASVMVSRTYLIPGSRNVNDIRTPVPSSELSASSVQT